MIVTGNKQSLIILNKVHLFYVLRIIFYSISIIIFFTGILLY